MPTPTNSISESTVAKMGRSMKNFGKFIFLFFLMVGHCFYFSIMGVTFIPFLTFISPFVT